MPVRSVSSRASAGIRDLIGKNAMNTALALTTTIVRSDTCHIPIYGKKMSRPSSNAPVMANIPMKMRIWATRGSSPGFFLHILLPFIL